MVYWKDFIRYWQTVDHSFTAASSESRFPRGAMFQSMSRWACALCVVWLSLVVHSIPCLAVHAHPNQSISIELLFRRGLGLFPLSSFFRLMVNPCCGSPSVQPFQKMGVVWCRTTASIPYSNSLHSRMQHSTEQIPIYTMVKVSDIHDKSSSITPGSMELTIHGSSVSPCTRPSELPCLFGVYVVVKSFRA